MSRWTPEDIKAFQRRADGWQKMGKVTTHKIKDTPEQGGRPSKYGNIRTEAEGMKFSSKKEKKRWMDLRLMEKGKQITDLERQVRYPLEVNGTHICFYIADFVYRNGGKLVVEDAKGMRTPVFDLKSKLMLAVHGVEILLT